MREETLQPNPKISELRVWDLVANHQLLIADRTRVLSYKKAIEDDIERNDVILDIGCGTGILSFFAARKGCKKIYAIEKSTIINCAIKIAKINNLDKNIEFIKRDILRFKPKEKIDVLIQEQIGLFIWNDDMIRKVAYIRDNYLRRDGIMIPFKIDLYFVPINQQSFFEAGISFWRRKRYGIDFSTLCSEAFIQKIQSVRIPCVISLNNKKTFLCREKLGYTIDLRKDSRIPRKIAVSFRLRKNSALTGMCCYFKVHLNERCHFSTGPKKINTCWKQIFLPCLEKKFIKRDSILDFTLFPQKDFRKWKFRFNIN